MSRISIIVPVFNRANLLPQTLRSLLFQTVAADEILVVDDGSTDGSAEVAESFGSPIRVIRQANAGPAAARNRGLHESTGDFLHFFDSDDLALPDKHSVQMQALEKSGADIAYGPWVKGHITESSFIPENQVLQQNGLPRGELIRSLLTHWSVVPHACMFRREIVDKIGGFPEELFGTEDQLMFLRCLLAGAKVVHSPGTLELYRSNDPSKITNNSTNAKFRHHREWGKFLSMAHKECLAHGVDPALWFGFRRRAWEAKEDLTKSGVSIPDLEASLKAIYQKRGSTFAYSIHRGVERKLDGIRGRWTGARGHTCFRMGPLTDHQRQGVHQLFSEPSANSRP
jgi:glycosyltransferase involved in cell wall biosynthesis